MSRVSRVLSFPWRKPKISAACQHVLDPPPAVGARSADRGHAAVNDNAPAASNGIAPDQTLSAPQTEATR
jgi:hypothetical protein